VSIDEANFRSLRFGGFRFNAYGNPEDIAKYIRAILESVSETNTNQPLQNIENTDVQLAFQR
jgi:hypothetical protein